MLTRKRKHDLILTGQLTKQSALHIPNEPAPRKRRHVKREALEPQDPYPYPERKDVKIVELADGFAQMDVCYICNDTSNPDNIECRSSPTTPDPQPLVLFCKDNEHCVESAKASVAQDMSEHGYLEVDKRHVLFRTPENYGKGQVTWLKKRSSGEVDGGWLIRHFIFKMRHAQEDKSMRVFLEKRVKKPFDVVVDSISLASFMAQNQAKLKSLLLEKKITEDEFVPRFPPYFPRDHAALWENEFRMWYQSIVA